MRCDRRTVRWGITVTAASVLLLVLTTGQTGCPTGNPADTLTCLSCHNGLNAQDMRSILVSSHTGVSCTVCHGNGLLHVQSGGQNGFLMNPAYGPFERGYASCVLCHEKTVNEFLQTKHGAEQAANCYDCHNVHSSGVDALTVPNNLSCMKCHVFLGFFDQASIPAHTEHPLDPADTGASRCVSCHMVPQTRVDQENGPHNHSFLPVPPIETVNAAQNGVTPPPPNSCAGVAGCHDGTVLSAPVFDVDNLPQQEFLQLLYQHWFDN